MRALLCLTVLSVTIALGVAAPSADPVLIPAGSFPMGSVRGNPDETPVHDVEVPAFLMDRHEVTNGEYEAFIEAGGYGKKEFWSEAGWVWRTKHEIGRPAGWDESKKLQKEAFARHPVVGVSYWEAEAYARYAGKRLPTEIEWEKAARGAKGRIYPWGDDPAAGGDVGAAGTRTRPVGTSAKDRTPEGIMDLGGNVAEWTSSWFGPYPGTRHKDHNHGQSYRVIRGGSWRFETPVKRRGAWRGYWRYGEPHKRISFVGIRLVKDAPKPKD